MEYCFHHIPKTAGSSLQLRLAHREHIGQLPKGSTLVVYPLHDGMRFYRVSEDPDFDYTKPIKEAFLRTYKTGSAVGKSTIVCGHYTNISQPGQHITWLMLNIDKEPRLSSNRSNKDYQKIQKLSDLSEEFKVWHRSYNNYDYLLYEEFCK